MSKTISKDEFINIAENIENAHRDYAICIYVLSNKYNFYDEMCEYLTTQAKNFDDLDDKFYSLFMGYNPNPTIYTVED